MTREEELAQDYNERKLKEERDRYEAQNQEAYDKEVSGENFLKDRAKENEEDKPDAGDIAKGVSFEIAAGLATDKATSFLLNPLFGPKGVLLYGLANFASGSVANAIAQRLRGDTSFSLGEVLSSGAAGIIPGTQLQAGKAFQGVKTGLGKAGSLQRAAVVGGLTGVGAEQIRVGIDEGRFLTAQEALLGGALGGTVSTGMQSLFNAGTAGLKTFNQYLSDNPYSRLYGPARRLNLLEPELQGSVGAMNKKKFSNQSPDDPNTYTFQNLPRDTGDNYKEFIAPVDTPEFRSLPPEQQEELSKLVRKPLRYDDWENLGLDAKYETEEFGFDQFDWNRFVDAVKKNEDDVYAIIKTLNKIETDRQIKKAEVSDINILGRRMANLFINEDYDRALEAFTASDLQKIIDNQGGYIEFSTDRMRRAGSLPYIIRDVGDIAAAVRRRLDEIADNSYFEFGHQKAALNVLLDDNAINKANYMRQGMPEEARSIIETRFRGSTLDDLLDNGFEGVVVQPGNRSTQAAQDLDPNINRLLGTAEDLEESFLNFMRPQFDIANEFPVNIRQNIIDDYMEELGVIRDELAQYGVDVNNSTFDFSRLNRSKFKEVLTKYRTGNIPLYRIIEIAEFQRFLNEFPELAKDFLTLKPGTSGDYAVDYLSNVRLTSRQKALLDSLKKKIDELGTPAVKRVTKPGKQIKKKETESGKYNLDTPKKRKKTFKKKDDDNEPPLVGGKRK